MARLLALVAVLVPAASACHEGEPSNPCSGVECSGAGTCFTDGVTARCDCNEGYRAEGLECVPTGGDAGPDAAEDAGADSGGDAASDATAQGLTCWEVIECAQACGADVVCAGSCTNDVCDESASALGDLTTCMGTQCEEDCAEWYSPDCLSCASSSCALLGFSCQSADC